jgi:hypothetical protein
MKIKFSMKGRYAEILVTILFAIFVALGCDKVNLQPTTNLNIKLANSQLTQQEINIDVKEVTVNLEGETEWISLKPKAGVYNLLNLKNGNDTLIASGDVSATRIVKQMRLILGDNNTIEVNKQYVPLSIATKTGNSLDVMVGAKMNKNLETVVIDFDAATSINKTADGKYELNPVLKVKSN